MPSSRAFRPPDLAALESRAVPSQVYFSPQTGIILPPAAAHHAGPVAEPSRHAAAKTAVAHKPAPPAHGHPVAKSHPARK